MVPTTTTEVVLGYKLRCRKPQAIAVLQIEAWHTEAAGCPNHTHWGLPSVLLLLLLPATHLNNTGRLPEVSRHTRV